MKKLLLALLIVILSTSAVAGGKAKGKDHGKGNPHMIICQIFNVVDWKWCRGDWTND